MEVIFVLLPLALVMGAAALGAFFWAVHRGQFDDLDTPRYRALFDDETAPMPPVAQAEVDLRGNRGKSHGAQGR